tara:strand:+ start:261 stop:494 length:234 start_codon:yes stop_codon:yes gene_type:complete
MQLIALIALILSVSVEISLGNNSLEYLEGKEAGLIIQLGDVKDISIEETHTHFVVNYISKTFWCTVSNNGEKVCTEF